jgi:hypothetical protein
MLRSEQAVAALHETGVPCDAKDPRPNALRLTKSIEVLKYTKQRILRYLLGILTLPAHQVAVLKDSCSERPDKFVKCVEPAVDQRLRKFDFRTFHIPIVGGASPETANRILLRDEAIAAFCDRVGPSVVAGGTDSR